MSSTIPAVPGNFTRTLERKDCSRACCARVRAQQINLIHPTFTFIERRTNSICREDQRPFDRAGSPGLYFAIANVPDGTKSIASYHDERVVKRMRDHRSGRSKVFAFEPEDYPDWK